MKPTLLFYCEPSQNPDQSIGSWAVAHALSPTFHVVLVTGGEPPAGMEARPAIDVVRLPPPERGPADTGMVWPHGWPPGSARASRTRILLDTFFLSEPAVVVTELFPFGHEAFTDEILPMLEYAAAARRRSLAGAAPRRPLVICSLPEMPDRARRNRTDDDRARQFADSFYDAILVHRDPRLATFDEAFGPRTEMRVPATQTCSSRRSLGQFVTSAS